MKIALIALLLAAIVFFATGCVTDDTAQQIAATCSQRMTLARDHHDSLSVLLACDQLRMIARAQQAADNAQASATAAGIAGGVAAGMAAGR